MVRRHGQNRSNLLGELVKSLSMDELQNWHDCLAECRTPEVRERVAKMRSSCPEYVTRPVDKEYLDLVDRLGKWCAKRCKERVV